VIVFVIVFVIVIVDVIVFVIVDVIVFVIVGAPLGAAEESPGLPLRPFLDGPDHPREDEPVKGATRYQYK